MAYQKIIILSDSKSNQPSKVRTKKWVEINGELRGTYNINSQIKFKTSMLKSTLYDYSDAYIAFKRIIAVLKTGIAAAPNNRNK